MKKKDKKKLTISKTDAAELKQKFGNKMILNPKIEIRADDAQDHEKSVLICFHKPNNIFDTEEDFCDTCNRKIYYRPHNKEYKRKICLLCAKAQGFFDEIKEDKPKDGRMAG